MFTYFYPTGAPVPLELMFWPSGIGESGMAVVATIASLVLTGIALRGFRQHASRARKMLTPVNRARMVRQSV